VQAGDTRLNQQIRLPRPKQTNKANYKNT
jgi:hypothetical protein